MEKINGDAVELALREGHYIMNWGKDEPLWQAAASVLTMILGALMLFG